MKTELDGKIYGIEPGNDGNRHILDMINDAKFGLAGWELVESSEAGMLSQVAKSTAAKKDIVFLGWEPHPMNSNFDMAYLSGGDEIFGPNYGGATVYTNVRQGYLQECPNVGKLLQNLLLRLVEMMASRPHRKKARGRTLLSPVCEWVAAGTIMH